MQSPIALRSFVETQNNQNFVLKNPIEKHPTFFVRSSSLLLPLTPERQRNEKNVVRRSFPKERQPNKTLHILSFLPRFIRSTIILSSDESKTKKEAMMSFHTRSCNLT